MVDDNLYIPINLVLGSEDVIERESVTAVPYGYALSNKGKWEMLISAKDVEVNKGRVTTISIQDIEIDKNTVAIPCAFCHHALGVVLKIWHEGVALVETKRNISHVIFLPIQDGKIEKGDLLAVINVFSIIVEK